MREDESVRGKMLFTGAVGCKESATAVRAAEGTFHWPVFNMLLGYAVELSLKAFLASRGVDEQTLKHRVGHDLEKALGWAEQRGFRDDVVNFGTLLRMLAGPHKEHEFRYLKDKAVDLPDPEQALSIMDAHLCSVGIQIPISSFPDWPDKP